MHVSPKLPIVRSGNSFNEVERQMICTDPTARSCEMPSPSVVPVHAKASVRIRAAIADSGDGDGVFQSDSG